MTGQRNRALGTYGETVAARHLVDMGMTLIDRNWTCPSGEVDLVLRDGEVVVFCEVKTRVNAEHGHPLEAVDDDKLGRLRRLADLWLEAHHVRRAEVRLDLVGVLQPGRGAARIEHVRGVC